MRAGFDICRGNSSVVERWIPVPAAGGSIPSSLNFSPLRQAPSLLLLLLFVLLSYAGPFLPLLADTPACHVNQRTTHICCSESLKLPRCPRWVPSLSYTWKVPPVLKCLGGPWRRIGCVRTPVARRPSKKLQSRPVQRASSRTGFEG